MPEEAEQAWLEAKEASQRARKALDEAKQKFREAEAHFNKCYDKERRLWVVHHEGMEYLYGKKDKLIAAKVLKD